MGRRTYNKNLAHGELLKMFTSLADGDVKTLPLKDVNMASLRSRATQLNNEAGFMKYRISVDTFTGVVRIANNI